MIDNEDDYWWLLVGWWWWWWWWLLHISLSHPSYTSVLFPQVKEHNIFEMISDPKNMSGVFERRSTISDRLARRFLKKPIKFVYTNGLVQQIYAQPGDPDWSVNMKKSILNMIHVDVTGKDSETNLKDLFETREVTFLLSLCFCLLMTTLCLQVHWWITDP